MKHLTREFSALYFIGAFWLVTVCVDIERVVVNGKSAIGGGYFLACLNSCVVKLFDMAALHTHDVIMVFALIKFEHRFAALEMVPHQQTSLLELGEHAINGR